MTESQRPESTEGFATLRQCIVEGPVGIIRKRASKWSNIYERNVWVDATWKIGSKLHPCRVRELEGSELLADME